MSKQNTGVVSALVAFTMWGVFPVFWKQLQFLPAADIVAHRTVWSLAFLLLVMALRRDFPTLHAVLRHGRTVAWLAVSGALLAANWIIYVWATVNGHIIEGALGYYITPFLNMLFGTLFYREKNNRRQRVAIVIALAGVALQMPAVGGVPWIALALAFTFSLYGLCKKAAPLESRMGITTETALLVPAALLWLGFSSRPDAALTPPRMVLIAGTGVATTLPLLFFGHAIPRIRLTTLGILQFTTPTLQFLIGWLVYDEPLGRERLISFLLIWAAVAIYAADAAKRSRSG